MRIDHPGDVSGKPTNESLFYVTGANPDDYFEAHVGINTSTPEGALHVKSKEGTNSLVVRDGKVVIGHNSAAAKFQIRQGIGGASDRDVFLAEALLSNDQVTNLFYITGSATGTGFFGSMNTGSHLAVSGTSFLTDVTASVGFSGSIGNFQTLNIGSVAVVGGTVNNTTMGGTTPAPVNQTAGTVQYRS